MPLDLLKERLPSLDIVSDGQELAAKSHDSWVRGLVERRGGAEPAPARAVLRPTTTGEVSTVLAWAQETATAVVPYGLGSGVCGAVLAGAGSVVLDMGAMDRILELNETALTVVVEAGRRGSELEQSLAERGYTIGHFPQSMELSSVGGWCATRASGQFSTLYGNIEDILLGCKVVLAGGRVLEFPALPRSATGPDLRHLFLGSEGTLGVFTELSFRIHPAPELRKGRAYALADVSAGIEALRLIMRGGWRPAVTRLYDEHEAGRHFAAAAEPTPVLLTMSEGDPARVETEVRAVDAIVTGLGGRDLGEEPVTSWLEHRNSVPVFDDLLDQGLVFDTIEVSASWGRLGLLYDKVLADLSSVSGMILGSAHLSHCYIDGANIYFTFVGKVEAEGDALRIYDEAWAATMRATLDTGGSIAHHHGIGRVRRAWLPEQLGESYQTLRSLKQALDPAGIMNPGALVDMEEGG